MRENSTPPAARAAGRLARIGGVAATALLAAAGPAALAQQAPAPAPAAQGKSVQELKAAIAEIRRRVEQQRQAATTPPASAAAADLKGAREGIEGLARTMSELRAERDGLRGQLLQARDDLARAEQRAAGAEEARKTAEASVGGRAAALERDLAAARARVDELAKAAADAASAGEAARAGVAERERELAAARGEAQRLAAEAAGGRDSVRTLTAEAEELRARAGGLEAELGRARAEAEAGRAEAERRLAAEAEALRGRLAAAEREGVELRAVAAASVEEVRSLSEQLIAALSEKEKLVAASLELSSSEALRELQLAAREEAEAPAVAPAGGPEAGPRAAEPGTARLVALAAPSAAAPAGAASGAWSKTVLEGSLFTVGSDRLAPEAAEPLAAVARQIRASKGGVRVIGHTDGNGDPDPNRRLSLRRAEAVRDYLAATYGFEPSRFAVDGQGEAQPIASNDTPTGRRVNRRVEVFVAR